MQPEPGFDLASSAVGHFGVIGLRILSETLQRVQIVVWAVAGAFTKIERSTAHSIKLHTKVTTNKHLWIMYDLYHVRLKVWRASSHPSIAAPTVSTVFPDKVSSAASAL